MKPTNATTIGHSLESYLKSRELVLGNHKQHNQSAHLKLRPHRRLVWDDGEVLVFRRYEKRGD